MQCKQPAMTTLPFGAFVDRDFLSWLPQRLPPKLERALAPDFVLPVDTPLVRLFGDGLSEGVFQTRLTDALLRAHNLNLPYHNIQHAQRVLENAGRAIKALELLLGELPGEFRQALLLGFVLHDVGHPGATFFKDAPAEAVPSRIDPMTTPVEHYSAIVADEFLSGLGFSPLARLVAVYVVYSSAYGGNTEHGRALGVHRVKPKAIAGCLMRACDVNTPGELTTSVHAEVAVVYGEVPATPVPITWHEFLEEREGFLGYVTFCLNELDRAVRRHIRSRKYSLTKTIGWRAHLEYCLDSLQAVRRREDAVYAAIIRSQLGLQGVPLG